MKEFGSFIIRVGVKRHASPSFLTTLETAQSQGWLGAARQIEFLPQRVAGPNLKDRFAALDANIDSGEIADNLPPSTADTRPSDQLVRPRRRRRPRVELQSGDL